MIWRLLSRVLENVRAPSQCAFGGTNRVAAHVGANESSSRAPKQAVDDVSMTACETGGGGRPRLQVSAVVASCQDTKIPRY